MSRTKNAFTNASYISLFYIANIIISLFTRKLVIKYIGIEFAGLNGTLSNIIGFLSLAELGISSSVIYRLYAPLNDRDDQTVSRIISVLVFYYRKVGLLIAGGAVGVGLFFPYMFKSSHLSPAIIYLTFGVSVFTSAAGYLLNAKQLIFFADQKSYQQLAISNSVTIGKSLIQIVVLSQLKNGVYEYLLLELGATIVISVLINARINTQYPWLNSTYKDGGRERRNLRYIRKDAIQIFSHQFASFVLTQTDQLFILAFTTLKTVGIYSNYLMLIQRISGLTIQALNGSTASVGNLISSGDAKRINQVYWELTVLRVWIGASIIFPLACLTNFFIQLWLGKELIMPGPIYTFMLVNTFILLTRQTNDSFLTCYGLFSDIKAPWIEAALNVIFSVYLGRKYGIWGIVAGTTISLIPIIVIWKPYFLFTKGFGISPSLYFFRFSKLVLLSATAGALLYIPVKHLMLMLTPNWINFIYLSSASFFSYALLLFLFLFLSDNAARSLLLRNRTMFTSFKFKL